MRVLVWSVKVALSQTGEVDKPEQDLPGAHQNHGKTKDSQEVEVSLSMGLAERTRRFLVVRETYSEQLLLAHTLHVFHIADRSLRRANNCVECLIALLEGDGFRKVFAHLDG